MKRDTEDPAKPMVGDGVCELGVRVPRDVKPSDAGYVRTKSGGMSVSLSPSSLPVVFVEAYPVWQMDADDLPASLYLAGGLTGVENVGHALVKPAHKMKLAEYQQALANTQELWEEVSTWPPATSSAEPLNPEE
jgi:hypothetical protein